MQAEDDVLVVERDAERLLDPVQAQVQRLAFEVQRPCGLGLPAARRQVRLQGLEQDPRAGCAVRDQRAELLLDERLQLRRVAQLVQEVGERRGGARRTSV